MCALQRDLTHNLPFHGTDNVLGAGDTPILVVPSLEVKDLCCPEDGSKLFFTGKAQGPSPSLPHLESGPAVGIGTQVHTSVGSGPQAQCGVTVGWAQVTSLTALQM